jgi:hypothetical protein
MLILGGTSGRGVGREPLRVGNLVVAEGKLAAGIFGGEADHQRVGKGPGLVAKVADIGDLHAGLPRPLRDARTPPASRPPSTKASDDAVAPGREAVIARQQDARSVCVLAGDGHNDRRRNAWITAQPHTRDSAAPARPWSPPSLTPQRPQNWWSRSQWAICLARPASPNLEVVEVLEERTQIMGGKARRQRNAVSKPCRRSNARL